MLAFVVALILWASHIPLWTQIVGTICLILHVIVDILYKWTTDYYDK